MASETKTPIQSLTRPAHESKNSLREFLLYLALKADPKRFFPFPEYFKQPTTDSNPTDSNPTDSKTLATPSYTDEEYATMYKSLLKLQDTPDLDDPDVQAIASYIFDPTIKIAFHGNNVSENATEYEFKYSSAIERIRNYKYPKRWYLYHGSRLGNWHSIVRNGIKNMSGTKLMTTGQVYGAGVYLSDNINLAFAYGSGQSFISSTAMAANSCVAVVEIFEDPSQYKKADAVYVIPNDEIIVPRYLLQMNKSFDYTDRISSDLLEYFKKLRNALLTSSHYPKRVAHEIKQLSEKYDTVQDDTHCTVLFGSVLIKMSLDGFPIRPPLIKLVYKLHLKNTNFNNDGYLINDSIYDGWYSSMTIIAFLETLTPLLKGYQMTDLECTDA